MNNNKQQLKTIGGIILLVIILAGVVAAAMMRKSDSKNIDTPETTGTTELASVAQTSLQEESIQETNSTTTETQAEVVSTKSESEAQSSDEKTTNDSSASKNKQTDNSESKSTAPSKTTESSKQTESKTTNSKKNKKITFPYSISGTGLVIEKVSDYEGVYLEDGKDKLIKKVAAIMVSNQGSVDVEYVKIELKKGKKTYCYELSDIPAGATAIGQEMNKSTPPSGQYDTCAVEIAEKNLEQSEGIVKVSELNDGSLEVLNLTDTDIPCVRMFYKFYLKDENAYLGGITYTAKVVDLKAGASQIVAPTHYVKGYSKVVMIRTYDTSD